jgi:hypothetical protein
MLSPDEQKTFEELARSAEFRLDLNEFLDACRNLQAGNITETERKRWDGHRRIAIRRRVRITLQIGAAAFIAASVYKTIKEVNEEEN